MLSVLITIKFIKKSSYNKEIIEHFLIGYSSYKNENFLKWVEVEGKKWERTQSKLTLIWPELPWKAGHEWG